MNVFITGAGGFLGRRLVKLMAKDSRFKKVYCLCRRDIDLPRGFISLKGSLEELNSLPPIEADVCIHLAAVTESTARKGDDIFKINADGTKNIVSFCEKNKIQKIVFLSSISVYLSQQYDYAKSKRAAEEHIKNSSLNYSVLRSSIIYGDSCPSFGKIRKFIEAFHIVPVVGNGQSYKQPVYVDEVCKAVIHHATCNNENIIQDLYGKTKMTYNQMVKDIAKAIGSRVFLLHLPKKLFTAITNFCYKNRIPFPIQPEQISLMCENLCLKDGEENPCRVYGLEDFDKNLNKYLK